MTYEITRYPRCQRSVRPETQQTGHLHFPSIVTTSWTEYQDISCISHLCDYLQFHLRCPRVTSKFPEANILFLDYLSAVCAKRNVILILTRKPPLVCYRPVTFPLSLPGTLSERSSSSPRSHTRSRSCADPVGVFAAKSKVY